MANLPRLLVEPMTIQVPSSTASLLVKSTSQAPSLVILDVTDDVEAGSKEVLEGQLPDELEEVDSESEMDTSPPTPTNADGLVQSLRSLRCETPEYFNIRAGTTPQKTRKRNHREMSSDSEGDVDVTKHAGPHPIKRPRRDPQTSSLSTRDSSVESENVMDVDDGSRLSLPAT